MKVKSELGPDIYFQKWQTPIGEASSLWLYSILQTESKIHFFLVIDQSFEYHVMTLPRLSPYKLIEEMYAVECISKYFVPDKTMYKQPPFNLVERRYRTWKMWGTNFINELDENKALSGDKHEREKKIFSYLVETSDEWIEFLSEEPQWTVYKNTTLNELVKRHLDEDL